MGQVRVTDGKAVGYLCRALKRLGESAGVKPKWRELASVRGEHFAASLQIVPNYGSGDTSRMVKVTLLRAGAGRRRERFIYLRPKEAARRLQQPRRWRKLWGSRIAGSQPSGKKSAGARRHEKLLLTEVSRDIRWNEDIPFRDLIAQVVVALLQLGLLPKKSRLRNGLVSYIERKFRFPITGVSSVDRSRIRKTVALMVTEELISHWSYPEDYRAFRIYVKEAIRRGLRDYAETRHSAIESPDISTESEMGVDDATLRPDRSPSDVYSLIRERRLQAISTKSEMGVGDAALLLDCSLGYVYRLIRDRRLQTISKPGAPRLLARAELERVREILDSRQALRLERRRLAKGKNSEAARKAVYRKHGAAPKIDA